MVSSKGAFSLNVRREPFKVQVTPLLYEGIMFARITRIPHEQETIRQCSSRLNVTVDKCKVIRIGRNNLNSLYALMDFELAVTLKKKGKRSWQPCLKLNEGTCSLSSN